MLYGKLDELAPFRTQEKWDNSGLLAGDPDTEVTKALLVLDITPEAVEEAARLGAQLIISHHPVIFHPLKALEPGTAPTLLARRGIAAICSHTCLDKALVNVTKLPYFFLEKLKEIGIETIDVHPDDEWFSCNCLQLRPGKIIMCTGTDRTVERLYKRGIEVIQIPYDEIMNGGGGLHCTTLPLMREYIG